MKKENGITLVALIVSVIVLLILATVSISLVINNGIIDKAKVGVDKYSEEEELEQLKLAVASAQLKGNGFLTTENLNSELQERFGEESTQSSKGWRYKNYNIKENGEVIKSILPAEYQQVEYIESTGTQFINTETYPKSTTKVVFDFESTETGGWNGWNSENYREAFMWGTSTNFQSCVTGVRNISNQNIVSTGVSNDNKRHLFVLESGNQMLDGIKYGETTIGNTATNNQFMYMFATHREWENRAGNYSKRSRRFL